MPQPNIEIAAQHILREGKREDVKEIVAPETSGKELTKLQREDIKGLEEEMQAMEGSIEKYKFLQSSLFAKVTMSIGSYAEFIRLKKLPENIDSTKEHTFLVLKMGGSGQLLFLGSKHAYKLDGKEIEKILGLLG